MLKIYLKIIKFYPLRNSATKSSVTFLVENNQINSIFLQTQHYTNQYINPENVSNSFLYFICWTKYFQLSIDLIT